jgi:mRNA-degrading endonuclease YafQ of YafQ-DinJ toxin-antitoxin module
MSELVLTSRFERAFRRLIGKNPALQPPIEAALRRLAMDANDPRLKTHHLSGQLKGLHACSVGYDCRIVFVRQKNIPRPEWKLYCSSTSALTKKSIENKLMKTNFPKCFISISTIGVVVAHPRRGQHPQIVPVAHRPAHAGMMKTLKMAGRINPCPAILCQYYGMKPVPTF